MADFLRLDVLDVAELDRFRSFVRNELPAAGSVSMTASITISDDLQDLTGELRRTRTNGFEVCLRSSTCSTTSFQFRIKVIAIVQVFREIVACPTLTDLNFRHSLILPVLDDNILQVLSLLHTSRSLSTLDLTFSTCPSHVEAVARFFSGNTTLRSCTLRFYPVPQVLRPILRPFMPSTVQSEANVGLKELVLMSSVPKDFVYCEVCENILVKLIACNTTLEKLEVGDHLFPIPYNHFRRSTFDRSKMARAVGCNRRLKKIRFQCSVAELKELVLRLVRDAEGWQANRTLSTLKLSLSDFASVSERDGSISVRFDWMTDLAELVGSNSTLKHMQVSQDCAFILERDFQKAMVVKSRVRDELERMLNNELRRNTSLESLSVGWWKLLRFGDDHEWQMTYDGPCLKRYIGECPSALINSVNVFHAKMSRVDILDDPSWIVHIADCLAEYVAGYVVKVKLR